MATGERMPLAAVDAPGLRADGRRRGADQPAGRADHPERVKLSCNWMAACGEPGEDAALYDTVHAVAMELCPALGIGVPVGKDSLSMRTTWVDESGEARKVVAPGQLVVTAFATLPDVRGTLTPSCAADGRPSCSSTSGRSRPARRVDRWRRWSAASAAQVPDLDDPIRLLSRPRRRDGVRCGRGVLAAYHDRSDGGLWATVCEMAFAGGVGVDVTVGSRERALFAEELGVVLGVPLERAEEALDLLAVHGLGDLCVTGRRSPRPSGGSACASGSRALLDESVHDLAQAWDEVSWRISRLRDNPACADEEHAAVGRRTTIGLVVDLDLRPADDVAAPYLNLGARPKVAILREQGVNSSCRDRLRLRPGRVRQRSTST
jgi:phosphoribosylformylglycinamidine synthase